ncbi:methyl-accepting chemotaxis protein [Priestia aryabhattai]|uniref:methyl-accepting chemotaxis protein n=1 Tax=Priestia aryabhattai TaxID=412384 RepID=UPI000BF98B43|nr:methyl-accepting chemotaxis protein [Priestia aryabhattai]MED3957460.1 methyl-accepting chemotaxis protein [Priestia aryabhattai]PGA14208.1 methyl-accepting chemotaxis protein [Priestia aryabhattai]
MGVLRNLSIYRKLLIMVIISTISLITVAVISYFYTQRIADSSESMYNDRLQPIRQLGQIRTNNRAIDANTLEMILSKDENYQRKRLDEIQEKEAENNKLIEQYKKTFLLDSEKEKLALYEENIGNLTQARSEAIQLAQDEKVDEAYNVFSKQIVTLRTTINNTLDDLQTINNNEAKSIYQKNKQSVKSAVTTLLLVSALVILLTIAVGLLIARMITKPLNDIKNLMETAKDGDFQVKGTYESNDEIGSLTASFNKMIGGLKEMIMSVGNISSTVAASSEELSASAEQNNSAIEHISSITEKLASGSNHQVNQIQESSTIIHRITNQTSEVVENVEQITKRALDTAAISNSGTATVETAAKQMKSINENVTELSSVFQGLSEHSAKISQINDVITTIADQTNLLALNAAIEAARAGDHGKGFAVVASEVRKLAEGSSNSANQIKDLVALIQSETARTLQSMTTTTKEVKEGLAVVEQAGTSFIQINEAVQHVVNQIQQIGSAIHNLAKDTHEVQQAIHEVNGIAEEAAAGAQNVSATTEEQLASMEEIASSAMDLAKMSEELQELIARFKI